MDAIEARHQAHGSQTDPLPEPRPARVSPQTSAPATAPAMAPTADACAPATPLAGGQAVTSVHPSISTQSSLAGGSSQGAVGAEQGEKVKAKRHPIVFKHSPVPGHTSAPNSATDSQPATPRGNGAADVPELGPGPGSDIDDTARHPQISVKARRAPVPEADDFEAVRQALYSVEGVPAFLADAAEAMKEQHPGLPFLDHAWGQVRCAWSVF